MWNVFSLLVILFWFYGGIAQAQLYLIGFIYVYSVHIKFLIASAIAPSIIHKFYTSIKCRTRHLNDNRIFSTSVIWLISSFINLVFLGFINNLEITYWAFSYNNLFYFPTLLAIIIIAYKPISRNKAIHGEITNSSNTSLHILLALGAPIIIFGIIQYLFEDPFFSTGDRGDYLVVSSYQFAGGGIRAFSIFTSGLAFAKFTIFFSLIVFADILNSRHNTRLVYFIKILVFLISQYAIYCSLTRSAYLHNLISLLVILLISYRAKNFYIYQTIILSVLVGITVMYIVPLIPSNLFDAQNTLNSASIIARLRHWDVLLENLGNGDVLQIIFGQGLVQNERFEITEGLRIDNAYLALFTYGGIFCVILTIYNFYQLFIYIYAIAKTTRNKLWIATASFLAGVPLSSFFSIQMSSTFIVILLTFTMTPALLRSRGRNA